MARRRLLSADLVLEKLQTEDDLLSHSLQIDEDVHEGGPASSGMGIPTSSTPNKRAGNRTPSTLEQEVATNVKRLRQTICVVDTEDEGGDEDMEATRSPVSENPSPDLYTHLIQLRDAQCARTRVHTGKEHKAN